MAGVSGQTARNQSKRATDKSEAVAGLGQVALVGAVAVSGVGVCVRIGRGVSAVAPVFASAGLGLSLPACIQGELGLSAVYRSIELVSLGAILVSDGILAVAEQHGQAALEVLGNRLVRELAARGRRNQADELRATTLPFLTVSNALG